MTTASLDEPRLAGPHADAAPISLDQLEAKILGRQAGMHWYALIVDAQSWRRVAERAGEMGYETYCPMGKYPAQIDKADWRARYQRAGERPLMPGYLFIDMPTERRRFDLFTPSNDPGARPEPLPEGTLRGYVADCAKPSVEPIYGCWGLLAIDGSPMALHEALIADMRLRERQGDFDLTGTPDDGKGFVAKWVKAGAWVQLVEGPFANFFGTIEEVMSVKLIKVGVHIFGRVTPVTVPLDWIRLARSDDYGILRSSKKRSMRRAVSGRG